MMSLHPGRVPGLKGIFRDGAGYCRDTGVKGPFSVSNLHPHHSLLESAPSTPERAVRFRGFMQAGWCKGLTILCWRALQARLSGL